MANCNGCVKQCEYGFMKLGCGGYLPMLGNVFYTVYFDNMGNSVVLYPKHFVPETATAEAVKIAKCCEYNTRVK